MIARKSPTVPGSNIGPFLSGSSVFFKTGCVVFWNETRKTVSESELQNSRMTKSRSVWSYWEEVDDREKMSSWKLRKNIHWNEVIHVNVCTELTLAWRVQQCQSKNKNMCCGLTPKSYTNMYFCPKYRYPKHIHETAVCYSKAWSWIASATAEKQSQAGKLSKLAKLFYCTQRFRYCVCFRKASHSTSGSQLTPGLHSVCIGACTRVVGCVLKGRTVDPGVWSQMFL